MPKNGLALLFSFHLEVIGSLNTKFTSILSKLQSTSGAFQVFQVLRYAALISAGIVFSWLNAQQSTIDGFESLFLLASSTSFFWLGGLLDAYILLQKKEASLHTLGILKATTMLVFGFAACSAFAILGIAWLGYPKWPTTTVWLFAAFFFLDTSAQLLPYLLMVNNRAKQLRLFGIFSSLGYLAAIALPMVLQLDLQAIVLALLIVGATKFIWLLSVLQMAGWSDTSTKSVLGRLLILSGPLMLATLLSQSAVYLDGYLVQVYFPDSFVAFRYGAREFPLVLLLANAISIFHAGEIAESRGIGNVANALDGLRSAAIRLKWALFPISILLLATSGPLFQLLFKGRFPDAVVVFDIYLLLIIPRLMFPQSVIRGFHQTLAMTVSAAIELGVNVILSLLLMGPFGIAGIAAATVIGFCVEKLVLLIYAKRWLNVEWSQHAHIGLWSLGSGLLLLTMALKYAWLNF